MGTRADFYVGTGPSAEWIGSIAWDGYKEGIPGKILSSINEDEYRAAFADFIKCRDDGTSPEMGWPWPWNDSCTTDCCYAFVDGYVSCGSWGTLYTAAEWEEMEAGEEPNGTPGNFPNMKDRQNTVLCGSRSGLIVIGG